MSGAEFARFANDLLRASTGIDAMGERAAERVGRGALKYAKSIAPVDTGETRDEMRLVRKGDTSIIESSTVASAFQEFGTSVMAPQPFIRPTVDEWAPRLLAEVEDIRDEVVRKL